MPFAVRPPLSGTAVRLLAGVVLVALLAACVAYEAEAPPPEELAAPEAAATVALTLPLTPSGRVTLNAVGDVMLGRSMVVLMDLYGAMYPFDAVKHLLLDADVTIGNLEGTFTHRGVAADKYYTFRTPPEYASVLPQAGIGVVSLGNNHAMDFGVEGLVDTIAALDAAGVRHSGAGMNAAEARRPVLLEVNGLTLAFLSYNAAVQWEAFPAGPSTPGVARAEAAAIREDVAAALAIADLVIVSLHAGIEYADRPDQEQRLLATAAVDAGAALVLGHHAHVLQGWQRYGRGVIVWGLGNFIFDMHADVLDTLGPRPFQTALLRFVLTRDGVESIEAFPVYIDPAQNRPVPAEGGVREEIEARIERLNAALD